jgi:hypothetical protein
VGFKFAFAQGLMLQMNAICQVVVKWEEIRGARGRELEVKERRPKTQQVDPDKSLAIPAPP